MDMMAWIYNYYRHYCSYEFILSPSPCQMLQLMGYRDRINDLSDAEQVCMTCSYMYMRVCVLCMSIHDVM